MILAANPRDFAEAHPQSSAAGDVGRTLLGLLVKATSHARNNATDWRPLARAYIEEVALQAQVDDWDGCGSRAVTMAAKDNAQALIDMFPFQMMPPEVLPDPDGEIALCWDLGPGRTFTATIGGSGQISYAGILGNGETPHGVEPITGRIPKPITKALEQLLSAT